MEKYKTRYNIFKYFLGTFFYIYYRPKFVNKKLVPKSESILVCGNHVHLFDQCLPILSTKRMLHYMAKKEYFDSKISWFFKNTGCISVDRENHGGTSKEEALEILNSGYALGIYPEGTRNSLVSKKTKLEEVYSYVSDIISKKKFIKLMKKQQTKISQIDLLINLKEKNKINIKSFKSFILDVDVSLKKLVKEKVISEEEYDDSLLLPIKYGTVSLASKSNAYIVPYGIKGKYKFWNNKLTIIFGIPFKMDNMTLEEANKKLRKEIINLIK